MVFYGWPFTRQLVGERHRHDGIGMGGQEKKRKNEGRVLGVRKRCSGCNGPAS